MTASPPPPGPPPGPPPAPYAGPPGFPPPGGGRNASRKGLWIALCVIGVVLIAGAVTALVLVLGSDDDKGGGGDDGARQDPAAVVQELVDDVQKDDCSAATELMTDAAAAADPCSTPDWQLLASQQVTADVGDATVEGDTATVPVDFTSSEGTSTYTFALVQVDGEWRVGSYAEGDVAPPVASGSATGAAPASPPTASSSYAAGSPEATASALLDAALAGDCATADQLVTPRFLKENGDCDLGSVPSSAAADLSYTVNPAVINGTDAKLTVDLAYQGTPVATESLTLVQQSGTWKVDTWSDSSGAATP